MMINISPLCKNCNCHVPEVNNTDNELRLHKEIDDLKSEIVNKHDHIIKLESVILNNTQNQHNNEKFNLIQKSYKELENKYFRLDTAHKQTVYVNQQLETQIMDVIDKKDNEKQFLLDSFRRVQEKADHFENYIKKMEQENKMYKNDIDLAVFLLKCKPMEYIAQKYKLKDLPQNVQDIIQTSLGNDNEKDVAINACNNNDNFNMNMDSDVKQHIHLPMVTYPPTAMFYSMSKLSLDNKTNTEVDMNNDDTNTEEDLEISMSDLIKILEKRTQKYEYHEMKSIGIMTDLITEKIKVTKEGKVNTNMLLGDFAELTLNNQPKKVRSRGEILYSSRFDKEISQIIRRKYFLHFLRSNGDPNESKRRRQEILDSFRIQCNGSDNIQE